MPPTCVKCGSDKLIPNVIVRDQGQSSNGQLQVYLDANPRALIFRERTSANLRAQVCGACGYTEFIVGNPGLLYEAYLRSLEP
jgi:hypothetical protein